MDHGFIARPLTKRQIDQAFPLIRTIAPGLPVERWRAFAARRVGRPGPSVAARGIMTVQNGHGYIHGLFSHTVDEHLHHGRVLQVDTVVVLDLFDAAGVAAALIRAMESVARALGCDAIHTSLPDAAVAVIGSADAMFGCFRDEGHRIEARRLCKAIDRANDNHRGPIPSGG